MISTSDSWKEYVKSNAVFHILANLYDIDGGADIQIYDEDFILNTVKFTDSVSGLDQIELGSCITNTFSATLNNTSFKFDDWHWDIIEIQFGAEYPVDVFPYTHTEWIYRGLYNIDRPETIGNTVHIECYDDMDKFNKTFYWQDIGVSISQDIPDTASEFVEALCEACDVTFNDWNFRTDPNIGRGIFYNIKDGETTFRDVLSYILEIVGGYARINNTGGLDCKPYAFAGWEDVGKHTEGWDGELTGGVFSPWYSQDNRFDGDAVTEDKWFDPNTEQLVDHVGGFCSDFIPVETGEINSLGFIEMPPDDIIYCFDASKQFVPVATGHGGVMRDGNSFYITSGSPAFVKYIRFNGDMQRIMNYGVYGYLRDNGGTISPWATITPWNGGAMSYSLPFDHGVPVEAYELDGIKQMEIMSSDVNVTGIRVYAYNSIDPSVYNKTAGTTGYMLEIKENPFVQWLVGTNTAQMIADRVWYIMDGFNVRPFNATIFGNPAIEAGDTVVIKDVRDRYYLSIITDLTFSLSGDMQVSCDILTPEELSLQFGSPEVIGYIKSHDLRIGNAGSGQGASINLDGTATFTTSVTSPQFINESLEEQKKGIEPLALSALEKIKAADILSYNYNREEDGEKKHIGLAIGEKYSVPSEVVATDKYGEPSGVDLYAMVSMAWKAIQEINEKLESSTEAKEKK